MEPDENYMDLDNDDFGYRKIVVERPSLNEDGNPSNRPRQQKADASLRDYEMVPLKEDIHEYSAARCYRLFLMPGLTREQD